MAYSYYFNRGISAYIVDYNTCNSVSSYNDKCDICRLYKWRKKLLSGDSGGPLIADNKLIGIVSWGYGCEADDYPRIYTKIQNYATCMRELLERVQYLLNGHLCLRLKG